MVEIKQKECIKSCKENGLSLIHIWILQIYLNYQESQKVYEQMEEFTQKIEDQDLSPEAVPGETPEEVAEQGFLQVDFNKLEEINPDVIAWIEIPGLEISYPVVQGLSLIHI